MMNMTFNPEYWDGLAKIKNWNGVCYGFHTEEEFYGFTEPIEDLKDNMVFLDFGCGPGRIVKTVAPHVKEYIGVDVSEGLIELAREHHKQYKNVRFVKCSGTDLSVVEDNSVDYLYERLVLIHVFKEWIIKYVAEFLRVLKSDGILCIPDFPRADVSTNGFTLEEMNEMLKDFRVVEIDTSGTTYNVKCVK